MTSRSIWKEEHERYKRNWKKRSAKVTEQSMTEGRENEVEELEFSSRGNFRNG